MLNRNKPFSIQQDLGDFRPASDKEKEYLVQMRPSSTFFKDGLKRFKKNKVAMVSFFIIVLITLGCIVIPLFLPYAMILSLELLQVSQLILLLRI